MTEERAAVELKPIVAWIWYYEGRQRASLRWTKQHDPSSSDVPEETIPLCLLSDYDALRDENERLKAENASLKEANEIDLGEKAPLIFESTELSVRVSELTRLLAEAEAGIRRLAALASFFHITSEREESDIDNPDSERGVPGHWKIDVDPATNNGYPCRDPFTEATLVFALPFVQRALQSGEGKEPSR